MAAGLESNAVKFVSYSYRTEKYTTGPIDQAGQLIFIYSCLIVLVYNTELASIWPGNFPGKPPLREFHALLHVAYNYDCDVLYTTIKAYKGIDPSVYVHHDCTCTS